MVWCCRCNTLQTVHYSVLVVSTWSVHVSEMAPLSEVDVILFKEQNTDSNKELFHLAMALKLMSMGLVLLTGFYFEDHSKDRIYMAMVTF